MGKHGESIYNKIRGIDDNPITEYREAKSIGEQTTLSANTLDAQIVLDTMKKLSDNVFKSFLKNNSTVFKTLAITVRFADFETKTSAKSFKEGIGRDNKAKYEVEIMKLLLPYLDKRSNPKRKPIRLIGVRAERLSSEAIHYNQKLFK
jgi:nucleotidyltransferase/DNA polymerase involved in DNA repair